MVIAEIQRDLDNSNDTDIAVIFHCPTNDPLLCKSVRLSISELEISACNSIETDFIKITHTEIVAITWPSPVLDFRFVNLYY